MQRRLHYEQPESFAFTPKNRKWAEAQMTKYPQGRQASAVIALLWRAQEQEGWISKPALETIADMLDMAYIRVLEVATFYFMFQLQPVGSVAHIQVCGTTSCMICGAEDLIGICKKMIAKHPHILSEDGKFSWEEVECLGACANAPMVQIGKDFYEDLTSERFSQIIEEFAAGQIPTPGPQNGRFAAEPLGGATTLTDFEAGKPKYNGSVSRAMDFGDTVKRIRGDEEPILTPWLKAGKPSPARSKRSAANIQKRVGKPKGEQVKSTAGSSAKPDRAKSRSKASAQSGEPVLYAAPPVHADNLKMIKGIGQKVETALNELGIYTFAQISGWTKDNMAWVDSRLKTKRQTDLVAWVSNSKQMVSSD